MWIPPVGECAGPPPRQSVREPYTAGDRIVAVAYHKRTHKNGELRITDAGQEVTLVGWVQNYRDHGGMVFVDLRDYTGVTQLKFNPETDPQAHETARALRNEYVIAVLGHVAQRGANINPKLPTGEIEVEIRELDLLNRSKPVPFEITDQCDASEDLRLKNRMLDLRRPQNQSIFRLRHRIASAVRKYFDANGFVEIETPYLTKSTPEGARDYLVPSRVQQGHFYALPQSPQIFKQLFMMSGFDRYAQIVRCFRDEDLRADRQPEFTQVDLEMAFVQADEVMAAVEGCCREIFKQGIGVDIPLPAPRISYQEAMDRYGIDRPDTRFGLELQDVTDILRNIEFAVFRGPIDSGGVVKCIVAKGADKLTRKITDGLTSELRGIGAGGLPLTKVIAGQDGPEFSTGVAKHLQPFCRAVCEVSGAEPGDTIFFAVGSYGDACKHLHYVRTRLGEILELIPDDEWHLLWVVDFPMFEWDEEEKRWFSTHHPFTAPRDEDVDMLDSDPGRVRAKAYDLVLNGTEMAGGSIRIHQPDVQAQVFRLLGIPDEEARAKFQFLMEALAYGAPPHGGIAFGLDRWVMILAKAQSLRDVVAFPKTQRAVCPLTDAPSEVSEGQLRELGIDLRPEVKAKKDQAAGGPEHVHRAHDE
ncbi:MAG: aspartate--tRNA ligase [bacterium]|nr:aspartate--tRNA ligase [bacterium]